MSSHDIVYPRTLASLFGSDGEQVVWKRVFLLFLAIWAAFNLPYAASLVPAGLLRSLSYPAALVLAGLMACWIDRKHAKTAFLAALLFSLLSLVPRLIHQPIYAESQLASFLGAAEYFCLVFLVARILEFLHEAHRSILAGPGLGDSRCFRLGRYGSAFHLEHGARPEPGFGVVQPAAHDDGLRS